MLTDYFAGTLYPQHAWTLAAPWVWDFYTLDDVAMYRQANPSGKVCMYASAIRVHSKLNPATEVEKARVNTVRNIFHEEIPSDWVLRLPTVDLLDIRKPEVRRYRIGTAITAARVAQCDAIGWDNANIGVYASRYGLCGSEWDAAMVSLLEESWDAAHLHGLSVVANVGSDRFADFESAVPRLTGKYEQFPDALLYERAFRSEVRHDRNIVLRELAVYRKILESGTTLLLLPSIDFGTSVKDKLNALRHVLIQTSDLRREFPGRLLVSAMTMPTDEVRRVFEEAG